MRVFVSSMLIVGALTLATVVSAQMSSTNFEIRNDSISAGGDNSSSSTSYLLRDTLANTSIGQSTSTSYDMRAGYRQGIFDQVLSFDLFAQNQATVRPVTAFAGKTITASTTGITTGDFVLLVQDEGISQVKGIGEVTSLGVGTITIDILKDSGSVPVIDGINDVLYLMNSSSVALGELDPTVFSSGTVGFNVNADIDNGYTVQVIEDGQLRDGAEDIDDVVDGTVSIGSEEYGGSSSDITLTGSTFDTIDTAFTSSFQDVADESSISFESRNFVDLKASIDSSTADGSYAQTLTFIISGNY